MNNFVEEHRAGRFYVDEMLVRRRPDAVAKALEGMVPLSVVFDYARRSFYVVAFSPRFEPTPEGTETPWYRVVLHDDGSGDLHATVEEGK